MNWLIEYIFIIKLVPPEDTTITDVDGNELKGLIGPYNEGDELKLICTTEGGKSSLLFDVICFSWWFDCIALINSLN